MKTISILDCTLRDGGYCNQWNFGKKNIIKCIDNLTMSNIDIIECGFITEKATGDSSFTKFKAVEDISSILPKNHKSTIYVAMINYGEFNAELIPMRESSMIDGIRVAFHKKDMYNALEYCKELKKKGYMVFVQAMVSMAYDEEEFKNLISNVNNVSPYAFYIVDSFGMMKKNDIIRLSTLTVNNLDKDIKIGFHSHNNIQLAYSNAITMLEMCSNRDLIVDTSVYGMGRGAGNLNTELFIDYMNKEQGTNYNLRPILMMMDEVINGFYQKSPWGYSLSNYLSAVNCIHPNYARYFSRKNTITVEMMYNIFESMDKDKKYEYSEHYAEELYRRSMGQNERREKHVSELKKIFGGKTVLLIAPGKSSYIEKNKVIEKSKNDNVLCISINHIYEFCRVDYVFVSNIKRYRNLSQQTKKKSITTTNIIDDNPFAQINYFDLTNDDKIVFDNGGLMAIKMLINFGAKEVLLAGFDGYGEDDDYSGDDADFTINKSIIGVTNTGMNEIICRYSKYIKILFITKSRYSTDNNKYQDRLNF